MKRIELSDWILDVDADKTKSYYENISIYDGCSCSYCRNYRKACETFSPQILDFYNMFGIDPMKEGEFMEFETEGDKHFYMGFYHLVGTIIKGPEDVIRNWTKINIIKIDNFKFGFNDKLELVPQNFPNPVVQLEFEVILPWLLNK